MSEYAMNANGKMVKVSQSQNQGLESALNRIARALERLADAQQQIAEQGEPVDVEGGGWDGDHPFTSLSDRGEG